MYKDSIVTEDFIRGKNDVQMALRASSKRKRLKKKATITANAKDKLYLTIYFGLLLCLAILKYVLKIGLIFDLEVFNDFLPQQLQISSNLIQALMSVMLVLTLSKSIKVIFINSIEETATRFNLNRVLNLISGVILVLIIVSILFANWYTAVVSLGLISLVLGFALQTPITSFIAWIYIIINKPFRVGDRIRIGDITGDVIDVGYLETTIWETLGDALASDHPTGRIAKFPNSIILNQHIINYSWPLFPFIWDEISFYISFESDLDFVKKSMMEIANRKQGGEIESTVKIYHSILKETAVDEEHINDQPVVDFRIHENTWIQAKLRYLSEPSISGTLKTELITEIITYFKENKDKVGLPTA